MGLHHRLVSPPSHSLHTLPTTLFDYIIIGGGTSGCLLAARLARSPHRPRILLVEAGGDAEEDPDNLVPGLVAPKFGAPEGNWLYRTEPQRELGGRRIVYPRGRGMGGSSAVNFSSWVRGCRCDWDDWADVVGDGWWRWDNVVEEMKRLEDFRAECPVGMEGYVRATPGMHGSGGAIGVGWGAEWQGLVEHCVKGAMEAGHELNRDHNDGDEMGVSVAQMNVDRGERRSSAAAFLGVEARAGLKNLTVVTRTICKRVVFEGKRAVGVELLPAVADANGPDEPVTVHSALEVVLSAGTFETPHILLLSGLGAPSTLATHSIPLVHAHPAIGQNIRDHAASTLEVTILPSIPSQNQLLQSPSALVAAREHHALHPPPLPPHLPEFLSLPSPARTALAHPNRPHTELWFHSGPQLHSGPTSPADSVLAIEGLCQNLRSLGTLTLRSADPRDPPLIDPAYLSDPFDWRVAVETVRLQLRLLGTPAMRAIVRTPLHGPGARDAAGKLTLCGADDEDAIREFVRAELTQGFHSMGSCVMGGEGHGERVVDGEFRVVGVQGLRIADMSVCPVLTNNHTQINAYLIAERCAQFILGDGGTANS